MTDESPVPHGDQGSIFPGFDKLQALLSFKAKHGQNVSSAIREGRQALLFWEQRHRDNLLEAMKDLEDLLK